MAGRGHGSGRASSPEAEAARREKIRQAASRRVQYRDRSGKFVSKIQYLEKEMPREGVPSMRRGLGIRVRIVADYRLKERPGYPQRMGWNYEIGEEYNTYIDPRIANNPSALHAHLNQLRPNRVHFRARVVEYL
jgi:hypothetical protein